MTECRKSRWYGLPLYLAWSLVSSPAIADVPKNLEQVSPVVVEVTKVRNGVAITVDGTPVGTSESNNLLSIFLRVYAKQGSKHPVVVMLDDRVSISDIWRVHLTAGKAELVNLRYFVFDAANKRMMTEVKLGETMPFSKNPGTLESAR